MSDPFLDRIREATVDLAAVDVDSLRAAAASASTGLSADSALTLVRVANGRPISPDQDADLRSRFKSDPPLLDDDADRQLLAVLAAEALINLFSRTNVAVGLVPALAMRCSAHAGWEPVHPDIRSHAGAYLRQRSVVTRRRVAIGNRLLPAAPKSEEDTLPRVQEEQATLRSVVQADRERFWERDQLAWWLLSETRPPTALGVARELNDCLLFLPDPVSADEMIASKLRRPHGRAFPETPIHVDEPIADLCAAIVPPTVANPSNPEENEESALVRRILDQILLSRAYSGAPK
jgi:hypothetical protein